MRYPGLDPGEMWRTRQWRKLLNLISHLPRDSFFSEAVSLDEEHVEMILSSKQDQERQKDRKKVKPRLSEYDAVVERLDQVIEGLHGVISATVAAAGSKKIPNFPAQPRPESAYDDALHRKQVEKSKAIADRFLRRQ